MGGFFHSAGRTFASAVNAPASGRRRSNVQSIVSPALRTSVHDAFDLDVINKLQQNRTFHQ